MHGLTRHPHLYCDTHGLTDVRQKTKHPRYARDWDAVRSAAEKDLEGPPIADGWPARVLPPASARAGRCAFAYRITEDSRFADRAREVMDAVLGADGWTGEFIPGQRVPFHLSTAAVCQGLALAYDLMAEDMSADERRRFVNVCIEKAIRPFLNDCKGEANPHLSGKRTMNWLAVLASGAGNLMLAMDGDGVDLALEIEIARAHVLRFIEWYDDAGAAIEHGGYWAYGMGNAVKLLAALRANGWPGIFRQSAKKLERTAYPIMCTCIRDKNAANFCDDRYGPLGGAARDTALILAAEFRDQRLQWWAEQIQAGGPLSLIFGDPDLPAASPDDLPTSAVFHGCGIAVLRSSMTDPDALFLALKAGRTRTRISDDPHCQFDLNAIVLDAFGTTLLADPGYGHNWEHPTHSTTDPAHPYNGTPPHNTLLVNISRTSRPATTWTT